MSRRYILLMFLIFSFLQTQSKERGLLFSVWTDEGYKSVFVILNNDTVTSLRTFPFIIVPQKARKENDALLPSGKLFFLQKDTIIYTFANQAITLRVFDNLKSIENFKDTFEFDNGGEPTEEEIKQQLLKEKVENNWDSSTYQDALETAMSSRRNYDVSTLSVSYVYYPYITLTKHWDGYGGGAHPNFSEEEYTTDIFDLFSTTDINTIQITKRNIRQGEDPYDKNSCCSFNDSLISLLQDNIDDGNFVDGASGDREEVNLSKVYTLLFWKNGKPHCFMQVDVGASYAGSGDYEATAQVDAGVFCDYASKEMPQFKGGYELRIDNEKGVASVCNSKNKVILTHPAWHIVLEEWSTGEELLKWKKELAK